MSNSYTPLLYNHLANLFIFVTVRRQVNDGTFARNQVIVLASISGQSSMFKDNKGRGVSSESIATSLGNRALINRKSVPPCSFGHLGRYRCCNFGTHNSWLGPQSASRMLFSVPFITLGEEIVNCLRELEERINALRSWLTKVHLTILSCMS